MRRFLVGIAIYVLLVPVTWASKGLYIGGGLSLARLQIDQFRADQVGYKAALGWRIMDYFAVEGSWQDWGTFRDTVQSVNISADVDGYTLEALGILPTDGEIEFFAKAGYFDIDANVTSAGVRNGEDGLIVGFGIMGRPAERLSVRVEGNWYDMDDTVVSFSFGVYWNFGRNNK